jgi:Plavaka transposase
LPVAGLHPDNSPSNPLNDRIDIDTLESQNDTAPPEPTQTVPYPEPPPPALTASGRPQRNYQRPAKYRDVYPEGMTPAVPRPTDVPPTPAFSIQRVLLIVRNPLSTASNVFGMWKKYLYQPSYDPDASLMPEDLYRPHNINSIPSTPPGNAVEDAGYSNKTTELLMNWQNTGSSQKSDVEMNRLVHEVVLNPEFDLDDLKKFNAQRENWKADTADEQSPQLQTFQEASIDIEVPSGSKHTPSRKFSIPGLLYRKITTMIKEAYESPLALKFHYTPFKLYHTCPANGSEAEKDERVYSEMYNSDALIDEHDKIQRAPTDNPNCKREKVVASLMLWSDATHLTSFGTAKMWPIYMLFGELSKYIRAQPNSGATTHLAYIPPFPDSLQNQIKAFHEKWDTQKSEILTHCRRELMHAVWRLLLDDDFLHAYTYGIVICCADGVERRVYPRIFTYSADYPEKYVILVTSFKVVVF